MLEFDYRTFLGEYLDQVQFRMQAHVVMMFTSYRSEDVPGVSEV